MDYTKMKNLAVDKCWEGPKSGDEYRSLRIQLDHFVDHISNADSPLSWLPLEDMTEDELSDIAVQFYKRSKENRLILSQKNINYNYNDLLINRKDTFADIVRDIPQLKTFHALDFTKDITDINSALIEAKNRGYQHTAANISRYNDEVLNDILREKEWFKCIGLGYTNTQYIEQYIDVCERICFGTLYFFIIANPNIESRKESLDKVADLVNKMEDTISEELVKGKIDYQRKRNFHLGYYGSLWNNADNIMMYYVQFLHRQSLYEEWNNIFKILPANAVTPISDEYKNPLNNPKLNNFQNKKDECKELIAIARERNNYWASEDDIKAVKILIREGFMEKSKYNRRTAMTIIRNILTGQEPTETECMFLDAKILRGTFREQGNLDCFDKFIEICTSLRSMFLMPYRTINDRMAYKFVHRICYDFIYIFEVPEYSKLKLE